MPFMQMQGQRGVDSYCAFKYREAKRYKIVSFSSKFLKNPFDKEIEFLYIKDTKSLDYIRLGCSVFHTNAFVYFYKLGFFNNATNFKNLYSSIAKELDLYIKGRSLVFYSFYLELIKREILTQTPFK